MSFDLPQEITNSFNELQELIADTAEPKAKPTGLIDSTLFLHVVKELASVEEEAFEELLSESRLNSGDVFALGIHDPGISRTTPQGVFYQSLCDASFLAERTGMNIVDAFPAQDIASRGRGGPIFTLPTWIFLKSEQHHRLLLDLGRTARLTFLPQAANSFSHQQIDRQDIVPCGSLLDALTWELTQGKQAVDLGGKLTVQGCQIPELLVEFRSLTKNPSAWNPLGLSPKPFLAAAIRKTATGHSYQDVLCTASCFIAEVVAEKIQAKFNEYGPDMEILLTGSARQHGMLPNLVSNALNHRPLVSLTPLGFPSETFDSLCVALLTLMSADRIPSSLPHLTGSDTTKPLGRLTPGSVANWQHLLQSMVQTKPAVRTLRSAM
jgi:1,6-anhydro-N-acetylmuramate kinase